MALWDPGSNRSGHEVGLDILFGDGPGAALAEGPHVSFESGADVERACAQRPQQPLVAGEREQVDEVMPDVQGHVAQRLSGVDQQRHAAVAADLADGTDRLERAGDVGPVDHRDQPRVGPHRGGDVIGVDQPRLGIGRYSRLLDHAPRDQLVQRAEHRVVVHPRRDRVAAGVALMEDALDGEIERIGCVEREDQVLRPRSADQRRQILAAASQQFTRLTRLGVSTPPGTRTQVVCIVGHRACHGGGLGETGGGIVEINSRHGQSVEPPPPRVRR